MAKLTLFMLFIALQTVSIVPTSHARDDRALQQASWLPRAPGRPSMFSPRKLTGRFLHITDIHPDPFYLSGSDPGEACHHSQGTAGPLGAEITDCDSPIALVNATFAWIKHNLRDTVDFIILTGDSARHDNDERIPRNTSQILSQNSFVLEKFREIWGKQDNRDGELAGDLEIPVIPSIGNNDILPHNIMKAGPNEWTKHYLTMWRRLIPEPQRHSFARGGWYYVEVIPKRLAVFSLNTMYFFGNNAAVDGCDDAHEPGYQQFEWLRVQLQLLRQQNVKAILSGHVPPARNDDKALWTESCWMKYVLWLKQYRDVVVGSMWGHMNVEHFFLQDFNEIVWDSYARKPVKDDSDTLRDMQELRRRDGHDRVVEIGVKPPSYLNALRQQFALLPTEPQSTSWTESEHIHDRKGKKTSRERYVDAIGGEYAERYAVSFVSASIVPNFYPTMRVFKYNITGLEHLSPTQSGHADANIHRGAFMESGESPTYNKKKKKVKPHFSVPQPPSPTNLPGPAYSPQTLSLVGYEQWSANLTRVQPHSDTRSDPKPTDKLKSFNFEVEYNTNDNDDVYGLSTRQGGFMVRNFLKLASQIGDPKLKEGQTSSSSSTSNSLSNGHIDTTSTNTYNANQDDDLLEHKPHTTGISGIKAEKDGLKTIRKKRKHHRRSKIVNKTWFAFVDRALVGTANPEDLHRDYGQVVDANQSEEEKQM